jgi:CBS domain-containing protein
MAMSVRNVMTVRPICVRPETTIREVAGTLVRSRISGVPVVDEQGGVVGMVSESDLQPLKEEASANPTRTAADAMTHPVVTLAESDTVTQAARVLHRHRIKRAPVVRDGRIVGIVTKSDLLRPYLRTDPEILADVEAALLETAEGGRNGFRVRVKEGLVRLEGIAHDRRHQALLVRLARSVDGVIDVDDALQIGTSEQRRGVPRL